MLEKIKKHGVPVIIGVVMGNLVSYFFSFDAYPLIIGGVGFSVMINEILHCYFEAKTLKEKETEVRFMDRQKKTLLIYPMVESMLLGKSSPMNNAGSPSEADDKARDKILEKIAEEYKSLLG